jgi:death-on-curing protein
MKYLTVAQVLKIHARQIELFGGDPGVRDLGLVESAVAQPRAGFEGRRFYPTLEEKAAALAFSLVNNHAFVDGNKRTGAAALLMFLRRNGYTIIASTDEFESVILRVAAGQLDRDGLVAWVRARFGRA